MLNVVATDPHGATGRECGRWSPTSPPGTLLFDATDPTVDDNGPGNYAYPTAADFHAGAYDIAAVPGLRRGRDRIVFRVRNRDLSPTFGSPLGAQLVDVYVHVPGLTPTSTAASFPQRNYQSPPVGAGTG